MKTSGRKKTILVSIGEKYNSFTVEKEPYLDSKNIYKRFVPCKCDCGNHMDVNIYSLVHGKTKACKRCNKLRETVIGEKFGKLTVISESFYKNFPYPGKTNKRRVVTCQCDCENKTIKDVREDALVRGMLNSCGCTKKKQTVNIGQKFNCLTVKNGPIVRLIREGNRNINATLYECECNCKNKTIVYVSANDLIKNKKRSCGCWFQSKEFKSLNPNPKSYDEMYSVWVGMRFRCSERRRGDKQYRAYWEKNIKVCPEWEDYQVFKAWLLANGWKKGLAVDRIDANLNYGPTNCQNITPSENSKRVTRARDETISALREELEIRDKRILELEEKLENFVNKCKIM